MNNYIANVNANVIVWSQIFSRLWHGVMLENYVDFQFIENMPL